MEILYNVQRKHPFKAISLKRLHVDTVPSEAAAMPFLALSGSKGLGTLDLFLALFGTPEMETTPACPAAKNSTKNEESSNIRCL